MPPFDIDWEDFDAELGMTGSYFSMAVGHPVVNHRGSLLFSLSLLKTGLGDITFSELSAEDRVENCDECAETEGARLIWICFDLMWEDRRGCTHWMAYVFDRPETKVLNGSIGGSPAGCGHAANVS
ncbi:MAG: hypothetical protein IT290_06845 [Deltaproteobacteria bacterium]|nr:hypothetical protein [Deltaproteobacteria bacterium]